MVMPAPLAAPGVELDIHGPAPKFSLKRAGTMQSSMCTPQEALFPGGEYGQTVFGSVPLFQAPVTY